MAEVGLPCGLGSAGATGEFGAPSLNADICEFSLKLPSFSFGFVLPSIPFPPVLPFPKFGFELSCKLPNPIDISAGLEFGGGRIACFDVDPMSLTT
jgi:hypothetical protein